jgi:Response regulator receiver domain.
MKAETSLIGRMDAFNMTYDYDLLDLIEGIAAKFADLARINKVQLGSFVSPELAKSLHGDKEAISALLEFLVEKAITASIKSHAEPGQYAVLVEALQHPDPNKNAIRMAVSDTRSELEKSRMDEIIESYCLETTSAGPIASLLEKVESKLDVDAKLLGRTCRIFFECAIVRGTAQEKEFVFRKELTNTKVFLVSNDPPPNRAIQHYCRHAGVHLEGAPTGIEAITELGRSAKTDPFKIVAIAPPIEDASAVELAHTIRSSTMKSLKLLFVAPWDDPIANEEALKAGFDEILVNPFRQEELLEVLQKLAGIESKLIREPVRVLIVEDNPINAKVAFFQLRELGLESETAEMGKER